MGPSLRLNTHLSVKRKNQVVIIFKGENSACRQKTLEGEQVVMRLLF
jgi:hypothetical protein